MRVLMTAGYYGLGGTSTVIENLASQLCKKGLDVTISALMFGRIPSSGPYDVSILAVHNVSKLKRFLDGFNIVHNHHSITNYLALISRTPLVYHYHGSPNLGGGSPLGLGMLLSVKAMNHAFDAVVAVSESGAAELNSYFGINNVHVIHNGVNTKLFRDGLDERFRKGTPQFLFVGNFYKHKNVEELILALKELVKAYPKVHLQIVGGGPRYDAIRRFAAELKLEDHVELVGRVSDAQLPYYYSSCNVYVTASRWELFGLPLLEAMACGKPVVASSIPPHVELLTKSKAGMLYTGGSVEDLCKKMTKTYEEGDKYRAEALEFAKEHDWSTVANQVLRIYAQILHN